MARSAVELFVDSSAIAKHVIDIRAKSENGDPLTMTEFLQSAMQSPEVCLATSRALLCACDTPFRIECPGVLQGEPDPPRFLMRVIPTPEHDRPADHSAFSTPLASVDGDVATFGNLGGDARLIVPKSIRHGDKFGHARDFFRHAGEAQQINLLRQASSVVIDRSSHARAWLNAAGAGVPWFHLRVDSTPKYYRYPF